MMYHKVEYLRTATIHRGSGSAFLNDQETYHYGPYENDRHTCRKFLFLLSHFPTNECEVSDFCLQLKYSKCGYLKF